MSRRTIAGCIDRDVHDRVTRWADWWMRRIAGSPRSYGHSPLVSLIALGTTVQGACAVDGGAPLVDYDPDEVHATHRAVMALRDELQTVVAGYWLCQLSIGQLSRTLDCAPDTIRGRLAEINGTLQKQFREVLGPMHNSAHSVRALTE